MINKLFIGFLFIYSTLSFAQTSQNILYVNIANPQGPGDGRSWATAYTNLQTALQQVAKSGGQIWVAQGVYMPTVTDNDRNQSFTLPPGVAVYGGFLGDEMTLEQRNWHQYLTILSGNIGDSKNDEDNSYHVVKGADHSILDGFVITRGNAVPSGPPGEFLGPPGHPPGAGPSSGPPSRQHLTPELIIQMAGQASGAGVLNVKGAPTIRNCIIYKNTAIKGAGMYNMTVKKMAVKPTPPVIENVDFVDNQATTQGARGGGMANDMGTDAVLTNVRFIGNRCDGKGGAIYNDFRASPTVKNGLFVDNYAELTGGAIANDGSSQAVYTHCTIVRNTAGDFAGGVYNGTHGWDKPATDTTINNSIIWANRSLTGPDELATWHDDVIMVSNSDVQNGYLGSNNIDLNPFFVAIDNDNFILSEGSPCIKPKMGYVGNDADLSELRGILARVDQLVGH